MSTASRVSITFSPLLPNFRRRSPGRAAASLLPVLCVWRPHTRGARARARRASAPRASPAPPGNNERQQDGVPVYDADSVGRRLQ
jgi:hypothetical protein